MKCVRNMAYKVVITPMAEHRLSSYIGYTLNILKNRQGAKAIVEDAKATRSILSNTASMNEYCENEELRKFEYRKIRFQNHRYIMIYRIEGDTVIVDGMFHELQDYENLFLNEIGI